MKIIDKRLLIDTSDTRITRVEIYSPVIAKKVEPGQFVILMVEEEGERLPLTVVDKDLDKQTIVLIFQEIGYSTKLLGRLKVGDFLYSLVGPLGHPTPVKKYGRVLAVGGGVGIAEIYPVVKAFKAAGNQVVSILGAKTKDHFVLKDEIGQDSDKLYLSTDDGSLGQKGFVSDVLKDILAEDKDFQLVYCVGPVSMMSVVSDVTKKYKIKTIVCLNAIMLDGTGMCGGCRLVEDGKSKFCCVDGPEFDGHLVDFKELMNRQKRFVVQEKESMDKFHKCKAMEKYESEK